MAIWMKLLHIVTAFWFIGGFIGREITMNYARRTTDIKMVASLAQLGHIFDKWMVIPGSLVVFGFGLITAWLQHWTLLGLSPAYWLLLSTGLYLSAFPIIKWVFIPRGKIFRAALEEAQAQGQITVALKAAFDDRAVFLSHIYEYVTTGIIVILMVTKPF